MEIICAHVRHSIDHGQRSSIDRPRNNRAYQPHTPNFISPFEAPEHEESNAVSPWKMADKWALLKTRLPDIGEHFDDDVPGAETSVRESGVKQERKKQDNIKNIFMAGIDQKV